ncbi:MAG: hypothetical protein ACYC7E_10690 [Armatimonadota bacterium]
MELTRLLIITLFILTVTNVVIARNPVMDLDRIPPEQWGMFVVIVADVPAYEPSKDTRSVIIERILKGTNVPSGAKTIIRFNPGKPPLAAGKYVLFLRYDNDTLTFGYGMLKLGPVMDAVPVKTAFDPVVSDIQLMIDTSTIGVPGLKLQRLNEMAVQMRHRELVFQYVLASQALIRNDIVNLTDAFLRDVVTHPEDNNPSTVILADRLFTGAEMNSVVTNQGLQWKTSDQRKALFAQLNKDLPKNDPARPYIEEVLRYFEPPKDAKTLQ